MRGDASISKCNERTLSLTFGTNSQNLNRSTKLNLLKSGARMSQMGSPSTGFEFHSKPRAPIGSAMEECIQNCLLCYEHCTRLVPHCLSMNGEHASAEHIGLLATCAQICQTSAMFMMYGSDFHRETCRLCAKLCTTCARDCERIAGGDQVMLDCAHQCRVCAESCERMATN